RNRSQAPFRRGAAGFRSARARARPWRSVELARLVDQHDRNAVADGIGQLRLFADQLLALRVIAQRSLGQRTHEDLEKFGIDRVTHCGVRPASPEAATAISSRAIIVVQRAATSGASRSACFSLGPKGHIIASALTSCSSGAISMAFQSAPMSCR